jgi:alkanesulfonate monooxygenase SsuD/methylene tetrahydromethanopterin reductase-like flavin-dependent oxidoreductase (luciferase family)
MDFGIFLDFQVRPGGTQEQVFKETFELIDLAEEAGLDTVWLGESHFNRNRPLSAQLVIASSIATRTKRLRVGTAVQVLPLVHPLRIAEEAATVDQISQGRFELGVGRSGNLRTYEVMGIDYEESRDRFQEALDIILKAWSGEPFSYHGKYNQITEATGSPLPYQKPHPKIRIAASGEDSFSRVGRLGFPIFLGLRGMDVLELETCLQDYHSAWREAGHPGEAGDISVRVPMYLAPTEDEALDEPRESIEAYFQHYARRFDEGLGGGSDALERRRQRIERLEKITYEEILETKVIFGSPARVVDRLSQYKEMLGLTGFTAELNPEGLLPPEAVHRSLELLTHEVMPAFKEVTSNR